MRTIIGYKKDSCSAPKMLTPVIIDESGDVYLEEKCLGKLDRVLDTSIRLFANDKRVSEQTGYILWLNQNDVITYEPRGVVDSKLSALQDHIRVLRSELIPQPKYRLALTLDVEDNMDRDEARKEARRLANLLGVKVIYDFNGKTVEIEPNES